MLGGRLLLKVMNTQNNGATEGGVGKALYFVCDFPLNFETVPDLSCLAHTFQFEVQAGPVQCSIHFKVQVKTKPCWKQSGSRGTMDDFLRVVSEDGS